MNADIPALRTIWRARPDDPAAQTVLALLDEIETLHIDLDRATRGEDYHRRDAEALREERWQTKALITAVLAERWDDVAERAGRLRGDAS